MNEKVKNYKIKKELVIILLIMGIVLIVSACLCTWQIINYNKNSKFEIRSINIIYNGQETDRLYKEFTEENINLSVEINEKEISEFRGKRINLEWAIISDDDLGCRVDQNGLFEIGNKLGAVTVQVMASSKNTATASASINIFAPESITLNEIKVKAPQDGLVFVEGQIFDPSRIDVFACFSNIEKTPLISDFIYSYNPLSLQDTEIELKVSHAGVDVFAMIPIVVKPKTLQSLEITKYPDKLQYVEGQRLDLSGIEVIAHYEYIDNILDNEYYVNLDRTLMASDTEFIIVYTNGAVTKEDKVKINVKPRTLQSIEIVSKPKKLRYIQGQLFDAKGIEVLAHFEYLSIDVSELIEWDKNGRLLTGDKAVTITYEENGVKRIQELPINVDLPYSSTRKIVLENPFDATLTWIFSYSYDGVTDKIDNTLIDGHSNLLYDVQNGVYVIPVGAVVTIRRVSPAVTDFVLNGEELTLTYPSPTVDFELDFGDEDINISFKKIIGARITLRFSEGSGGANWAFIYPLNYNGVIRAKDLDQLSAIYEDSDTYYFVYQIGEETYTFAELCNLTFSSDTFINVKRVERQLDNSVKLIVKYPDGSDFDYTVGRNDEFAFDKLPVLEKAGYDLNFSLTQDGAPVSAKDFKTWLLSAVDGDVVFAVYSLNAAVVSGDILGEWSYSYVTDEHSFVLNLSFNANGTYSYVLIFDSELNCEFEGIYCYEDEAVTILSLDFKGEYQLIKIDDFTVEIDNGEVKTKLFVVDGLSVMSGEINLLKVV